MINMKTYDKYDNRQGEFLMINIRVFILEWVRYNAPYVYTGMASVINENLLILCGRFQVGFSRAYHSVQPSF